MKAIDILNYIPADRLEFLAASTEVNYKSKKLDGLTLFQLLLYSMLTVKQNSLRVMEEIFSSYSFQKIKKNSNHHTIKHSSISERLKVMDSIFFKRIYEECCERFSSYFTHSDIIRFDSTLVSVSSKLIDYGFRSGGHKGTKNQLKFTIGLTSIPVYTSFFHKPTYNSEDVALREAILDCRESSEKIVVFDRGIQSRRTYDEFNSLKIDFVSRLKPNAKCRVIKNYKIKKNQENENIEIKKDSQIELFDRTHKATQLFLRKIVGLNKKTGEEVVFLTNIPDLTPIEVADIYKRRWEIEVFFKFLKQELNLSHLISRDVNGINTTLYLTLIAAILLTVYKKTNQLKGYKIPKLKFSQELELELMKQVVILCGGDPAKIP